MFDQLTRLTTALADRYRIERELGGTGMAMVAFFFTGLLVFAACQRSSPEQLSADSLFVDSIAQPTPQPEAARSAWWLTYRLEPIDTIVLGQPVTRIAPEWHRASLMSYERLPAEAADDPSNLADPGFGFLHEGDFNQDGQPDRAAVGTYVTKAGELGEFMLVQTLTPAGEWEIAILDQLPGEPGFSVIHNQNDTLSVAGCMECDNWSRLAWVGGQYEWAGESQETEAEPIAVLDSVLSDIVGMRLGAVRAIQSLGSRPAADSKFIAFRERYVEAVDSVDRGLIRWDGPVARWLSADWRVRGDSVEEMLLDHGLGFFWSEGSLIPTANTEGLLADFGDWLSPVVREFLDLVAREESDRWWDDGRIIIPREDVGNRLVAWESFLENHPTFPLRDEVQRYYDTYLRVYLKGTSADPIYNIYERGDRTVFPSVRESFRDFVATHGDTRAGRIVAEYLEVLAASGFRDSPEVQRFLEANLQERR